MSLKGTWQAFDSWSNADKAKAIVFLSIAVVIALSLITGGNLERSSNRAAEFFDQAFSPLIRLIATPLGYRTQVTLMRGFDAVVGVLRSLGMLIGVVGFAILFWGYAIHQFIIMLPGLIIGGALGAGLFAGSNDLLPLIGAIVGAIIGGSIVLALYALGVFLLGFLLAYVLVAGILNQADPGILNVAAGIVGGILALALEKFVVILYTSVTGAVFVAGGFAIPYPLVSLGLVVVGIYVQYHLGEQARNSKQAAGTKSAGMTRAQLERRKEEIRAAEEHNRLRSLGDLTKGPVRPAVPSRDVPIVRARREPSVETRRTRRVILTALGERPEEVILAIMRLLDCDRALAEETISALPQSLYSEADEDVARNAQRVLETAGATVVVETYSTAVPEAIH